MDKRTLLMVTAKRLFSEDGFYGTPTARIAKEAGVSNGILFHYFPTKDDLILALYVDIKDQLFAYTLSQVYQGAGIKESMYTFWLAAVEWNLENPYDFKFMMQFENSPFSMRENELEHRYVRLCEELAQKGIDQQIFKHVSAKLIFYVMNGLVATTVRFLSTHPELQDDIEYKNRLFEMSWDAMSKK